MLESEGNRDRKTVHQTSKGGSLFMHIQENFSQSSIFVFAGSEIDFVTSDNRLLGIAGSLGRGRRFAR